MKKYNPSNHEFNKWVDLSTKDIKDIVLKNNSSLERSDMNDIILELCQRVEEK